jgi:hypothetical protein
MSTEQTPSRYDRFGKAYYEKNKETLLAAEKEKKRWVDYYERNKEVVKERNRIAYYKRKGVEAPPRKEREPKPVVAPAPLKSPELARVEQLVAELRTLIPGVMKVRGKALPDVAQADPLIL